MTTIPRSSYRLQFHDDFDFAAAGRILPYLAQLGISHVYCSPIWQARPGSTHGYDVVDHGRISDSLGGVAGFRRFAAEAKAHGLGLLLDIVPNHMGVFGATNPWWLDVLENGQASPFAAFFDIDWRPPNRSLRGRLLVPVLGDPYGAALEAGLLRLAFDAALGRFEIRYEEHLHPIDPATYPRVLQGARHPRLDAIAEGCAALPSRDDADPMARTTRRERERDLQRQLAEAVAGDPAAAAAVEAAVAAVNEEPGRDRLSELHDAQAFRLSHWRVASGDINYRRFFDINALAALRIEDPRVFAATQGLALDLAAEGVVDGLRIDHSDGLYDPAAYFERLQQSYAERVVERTGAPSDTASGPASDRAADFGVAPAADPPAKPHRPLYLLAEKILATDESLPPTWALHGTTGYDFAVLLNGLFVERRNAERLDRVWRTSTGNDEPYRDIVRDCKKRVATKALASELTVLSNALQRIALADRRTRDYSIDDLRTAIADTVASLPVYRTYVTETASAEDRHFVEAAIDGAKRHTDLDDPSIFDFVRAVLLPEERENHDDAFRAARRRFAMRFQQFASPVAAKGVEDTAFYRYHRLISLNEVGGTPSVFGTSAEAFHRANAARLRDWPHTMLASSTHDNKRAEDVRMRIDVLSEQPAALRLGLRRWRRATRRWVPHIDGRPAPSLEDQVLLYQTLVGSLPAGGFGAGEIEPYQERIVAYMTKAAREAKLATRWSRPDDAYEAALTAFVGRVLQPEPERPGAAALLDELLARAAETAWFGALNTLSASVLKLTVPGMPDIYQGTELIDLSLVDPDNRRPVDYAARLALLARFEAAAGADGDAPFGLPVELIRSATDGRIKLWCAWRLLQARKANPALFASGQYLPLPVRGSRRQHAIAFARRGDDATLIVVAGRKFTGLGTGAAQLPGADAWGDSSIARPAWLAPDAEGIDLLSGKRLGLGGSRLRLGELLDPLTVAALLVPSRRH